MVVKVKIPAPLYLWLLSKLDEPVVPRAIINITMDHGTTTYVLEPKDRQQLKGRMITHLEQAARA